MTARNRGIRPCLLAGEGVTLARQDVHYVVTEFGIAYLFGKSMRERATALIEIAHPDFRESLLEEAKRQALVPAAHGLVGRRDYLVEEERTVTLKSGSKIMLRPAHGADVHAMQLMFHRMSSEDAYMRFFRRAARSPTKKPSASATSISRRTSLSSPSPVPARTRKSSAPAPISSIRRPTSPRSPT